MTDDASIFIIVDFIFSHVLSLFIQSFILCFIFFFPFSDNH